MKVLDEETEMASKLWKRNNTYSCNCLIFKIYYGEY